MTPEAIEQLKRDLQPAFERHGVRLAYLFGSQVTGNTHSESDTDVAVLLAEGIEPKEQLAVRLDLIGALMDACRSDAVDLAILNEADPVFQREVVRSGVLLRGSANDAASYALRVRREFEAGADDRRRAGEALRARITSRVAQRNLSVSP